MKKFSSFYKKGLALALAAAVILTSAVVPESGANVAAKKKAFVKSLKIGKETVSVATGSSVKVKVTVKTKGKAKKDVKIKSTSAAFSVKAGKANKKGVSVITVTGKTEGMAFVTVTTKGKNKKGKTISKKFGVSVVKSAASKSTDEITSDTTQTNNTNSGNSSNSGNSGNTNLPTATPEPKSTETPVTDPTVKWSTTEEKYDGLFSVEGENGGSENVPIKLLRKYVSFNPWPTTNAQVQYVIKNCKDPYVIAALYIVALDNMEKPDSLNDSTNKVFDMLESLQTGAGAIATEAGSDLLLNAYEKQHINEYWGKSCPTGSGGFIAAHEFASRTFLKGAKDTNGYTPEGGLTDKTKWQIIIDQYPYCFDQQEGHEKPEDKTWITLCPRRFTYTQDTPNGPLNEQEHSQVLRIGFRWNKTKNVWVSTDYAKINTDPGSSPLVQYNVQASILFSNNYRAPQEDQGF